MSFPSKFGKYLLLERVNVGGMAEVFKAKTFGVAGFERILAIKRILPNLVEDDEFIRMFIDEARIAVQLNHANIVQIYELGKHGEHYYIAMEYIPSRDLRGILDRLRSSGQLMPIPQAAYITAKTAEGLDYAHRRKDPQGVPMNIIHRDVSPQNVLVGYEGEVKVIDFGIAKAANRASKTQAGVLKGKFGYMSPEQVRGLPIDRRSDIFAVGVLLYEMLTGERLFIGESDFSTLERVRNAEVIPPTSFNKKISPQLEQIVLKTLAREVEDRYSWASELAQDLQGFMADNSGAFNARRLSMSMKEVYAVEVASERSKLEEFLRINPDDVKERGAPQSSTVMPLPRPAPPPPPTPLSASARNRPAPPPQPSEDEAADEFGEDKTFVIEASVAGMALGQQATDPNLAGKGGLSKQQTAPPQQMITDNSPSADEDVSLYGGNQESEEDDARTLVGAENPYYKPGNGAPPAPPAPTVKPTNKGASRQELPTKPQMPSAQNAQNTPSASSLVDEPMISPTPPPPAPRASSPNRAVPAVSQPTPAFDPVMAAMMEEDPGASSSNAKAPTRPPDPPRNGGRPPALAEITGPQPSPAFSPNAMATQEGEANPFAATPSTPVSSPAPQVMAGAVNWKPLIAALGGSGALFLASIAFFAIRLVGSGEQSPAELVLSPVGAPAPIEVSIVVDNQPVGKGLPVTIPFPAGEHSLEVSGKGMVTVRRTVVGTGGTMRQPVFIIVDGAEPVLVAEVPKDPKNPKDPKDPKDPLKPDAAVPPPVVTGGWRLSLAAVSEDGLAVVGAEVFVNGKPLGMTPFEAELDPALETVLLKVRKDGFNAAEIDLKRGGRTVIGPATVSLKRASASASAPVEAAADPVQVAVAAVPAEAPKDPPRVDDAKPAEPPKPVEAAKPDPPVAVAAASSDPPKPVVRETPRERQPSAPKPVAEIQLSTQPYSEVTIDGRKYGSTPFYGPRKLTLPVGAHKVEFFDKQNNKKYRYQIKLKASDPNNKILISLGKDNPPRVEGQVELKKLD
ncbi:MAG: protein kinase [Deltaproteobacteria bacterium]|nr:protein kinase [Deltaproteobacteria bacterium]